MLNYEEFYKKFGVSESKTPYEERHMRRLAWRNERNLYKVKCAKTGASVLSMYAPDSPFPIYSQEAWYGDDFDALQYGQDFDFNRGFFEQFNELQNKVPRLSNIVVSATNCDYCNIMGFSKNCYLIFGSINCEDCMYGSPFGCKKCIDTLLLRNSEFCYECLDSDRLYECFHCQDCYNSRGLRFCYDLSACEDCFLCAGLRHKKNYILNKPYSKEDYESKVKELNVLGPEKLMEMLSELRDGVPHKYMVGFGNENVVGDHVINSKDCNLLFNAEKCENVDNSTQLLDVHNCLDCDYAEISNFVYNTSGVHRSQDLVCCHWIWEVNDLAYCSICTLNTKDCFGCISLMHKQYCILNKQYTKEEYEELVPRIIEHMKKTGEWGEFFPIKDSPFSYNDSIANEYFPMEKDEVLAKGWKWTDPQDAVTKTDYSEDENVKKCGISGRFFRIMPYEKKFYERYNLPLPKLHPDERHKKRLALRNPRQLWDRKCTKCGTDIKTSYSPDKESTVYCEKCYLENVY